MKRRRGSLAVGFPTALNILVLTAFACAGMLSLSRAQTDRAATAHGWDVTRGYYAADSRGQALLGELEASAALPPAQAGMEMEALLNDQGIAARYDAATQQLSFPLPAGEAGTLHIQLRLTGNGQFEITEWRLASREGDES